MYMYVDSSRTVLEHHRSFSPIRISVLIAAKLYALLHVAKAGVSCQHVHVHVQTRSLNWSQVTLIMVALHTRSLVSIHAWPLMLFFFQCFLWKIMSCWNNMVDTRLKTHGIYIYHSVPGKRPLPGKRSCAEFQGVTVAASIQTYGIYIPGKRPCGPKSRVMFKRPWLLTRDTMVIYVHVWRYYYFNVWKWQCKAEQRNMRYYYLPHTAILHTHPWQSPWLPLVSCIEINFVLYHIA